MSKKLNVILDIDETFVHFIKKVNWPGVPEEYRTKYEMFGDKFVIRPHLDEFMNFLFDNCATVNLWTWSDMEYAEGVAKYLAKRNPRWQIANIWADDDAAASSKLHGKDKDLNYIWYEKKLFNPCDTILIDDLPKNTINSSNYRNGINIPAFVPEKDPAKFLEDDVLLKVIKMLQDVMNKSDFCEDGDLPFPFPNATLQNPNKIGGRRRKTRKHTVMKKRVTRKRKLRTRKTRSKRH